MIWNMLQEVKAKLSDLQVKSLAIGLETGIGSKDCPFIRIVPARFKRDSYEYVMDMQIVFGVDVKNRAYEDAYQEYFIWEKAIRETLEAGIPSANCIWLETITDEDRVRNLKTGISIFSLMGMVDDQD